MDAGSFAGTANYGREFPKSAAPHFAQGCFAGLGANMWLTNANSASDLAGPFHNVNLNLGVGMNLMPWLQLGMQVSWDSQGTVMFTISPPGAGFGFGASASTYDTFAWTVP
jgi:hypothetical protein